MPNLFSKDNPSTVKVFMSGNSQAVRLPKAYRFDTDTLIIQKIGDSVVLTPKSNAHNAWDDFYDALNEFDENFIHQLANHDAENKQLDMAETDKNTNLDYLFLDER